MSEVKAPAKPKKTVSPGVQALRDVVEEVYAEAREAKLRGEPVGWSSSKFPCELAEAFGLHVVYPENQAAGVAANRDGEIMMVKEGDVDGMVSGAIHSTGDLLRPGLQVIKTAPGIKSVSSFFVMEVPNCKYGQDGMFLFADCAVTPLPTAEDLANIAVATAKNAKNLCNMDPKVAMLSFSTKGSAKHDNVTKVVEATKLAQAMDPGLALDGELQLDAALVQTVADLKAPGSKVAGHGIDAVMGQARGYAGANSPEIC